MAKNTTTKTNKSKSSKSSCRTVRTGSALTQDNPSREYVRRDSSTGEFVAAKTGRVVKSSPAEPRLGRERIQTAVKGYVHRDG